MFSRFIDAFVWASNFSAVVVERLYEGGAGGAVWGAFGGVYFAVADIDLYDERTDGTDRRLADEEGGRWDRSERMRMRRVRAESEMERTDDIVVPISVWGSV